LQKNLAPNISRCSRPLRMWIQVPKTVRRLCRSLISSTVPASDLLGPRQRAAGVATPTFLITSHRAVHACFRG
jgi:hypothetical protein